MSDAKAAIMADIQRATSPHDAGAIKAQADALIANPDALRPDFSSQSNIDRFVEKATSERVTATVEMLATRQDIPQAVEKYLSKNDLENRIALQPRKALLDLNWGETETHSNPAQDEAVAVSFADMGIAETGSVVFLSAPDAPVLMNFLSLHHLVVLQLDQILRYLEDVFPAVGLAPGDQPRSINIITGTSGTADIEAKNIRGAHGPRYMHILVISELSQQVG